MIALRVVQGCKSEVGQVGNPGCHCEKEGTVTVPKHIGAWGKIRGKWQASLFVQLLVRKEDLGLHKNHNVINTDECI